MKNVIGLEVYREYQKEIERLKKKVMDARSENDMETSIKLVHNDEFRQTITKYFAISLVLILVGTGLLSIYLKIIQEMKYFWLVLIAYAVWGITFIVLFNIVKGKKKKILATKELINEQEIEIVKQYKQKQEGFSKIVLYVVCLNEYYFELIGLENEELNKKWKEVTDRQVEIINKKVNYVINMYTYQEYFNEWLAKQEIYG